MRLAPLVVSVSVLAGLALVPSPPALGAETDGKPEPRKKACPPDKVWNDSLGGCVCGPGTSWDEATRKCTSSCPPGKVQSPQKPGVCITDSKRSRNAPDRESCPSGKQWSDAHARCVVICRSGTIPDAKGAQCVSEPRACAQGQQWSDALARCVPGCPSGSVLDPDGVGCVEDERACPEAQSWSDSLGRCAPSCPSGSVLDARGGCVASSRKSCPAGKEWIDAFGGCVPQCPANMVLDFHGIACHPIKLERRPPPRR